jgi:hypothetical protein
VEVTTEEYKFHEIFKGMYKSGYNLTRSPKRRYGDSRNTFERALMMRLLVSSN